MIRRLFKTGNSIVLSLPKEALDMLNLGDGKTVKLEIDTEQRRLIISPAEPLTYAGVDEDFAHQVKEFIARYHTALDELAK